MLLVSSMMNQLDWHIYTVSQIGNYENIPYSTETLLNASVVTEWKEKS